MPINRMRFEVPSEHGYAMLVNGYSQVKGLVVTLRPTYAEMKPDDTEFTVIDVAMIEVVNSKGFVSNGMIQVDAAAFAAMCKLYLAHYEAQDERPNPVHQEQE